MKAILEFTDKRMEVPSCCLCQADMRVITKEITSFGESAYYQCDECGAVVQICNMVDFPKRYEATPQERANGVMYWSLRTFLKEKSDFPSMPGAPKPKEERDKVKCQSCPGSFVPRANAKSDLQTRFCPECRANGAANQVLVDEKKQLKNRQRGQKAAATRKKNNEAANRKKGKSQ